MKKILLLPLWFICFSITIGCSDGKSSSDKNVTINVDSIDSIITDSPVEDSLSSDSVKKDSLKKDSLKKDSLRRDSLRRDSLRRDSLRRDSLKADSLKSKTSSKSMASDTTKVRKKQNCEAKCVWGIKWIIGVLCFILGIALTLCTIYLIKLVKSRSKELERSDAPVIQAEEISEADKQDKILKEFIIEK